jgi:Tfp pilus assembly protein PilX
MEQNRGVALILALLVLSFLMVLGGALLATSTIDIWIGDNYKKATQSLYLAEAGIDHGREVLRTSGRTASEWLNWCAGVDGELQTSDDRPLIESVASGAGSYEVWIKNDVADRVAAVDTNEVLILTSISRVGDTRKTIEVAIEKGRFPDNVTDPRLSNIPGLENLAESITRNATDVHAGSTTLADVGGPIDYRVVVVNGNLETGPGTGHGLLLVRGELHVVADTTWNGLIVLIGQGVVRLSPGAAMIVNGALFTARTRAPDGSLLPAPEDVVFNISDTAQMKAANRSFPYNPIAVRER